METDLRKKDGFLARFLSDVANKVPPHQEDLKAVAQALIEMNDQGASFKKAFRLTDSRGRKPSKQVEIPRLESFQSMSEGWLGNAPFWLMSFLSKVNQQLQPRQEYSQEVANALIKVRDKGESFKSAFGTKDKTGQKEIDITQIPFKYILNSHKRYMSMILRHQLQKN